MTAPTLADLLTDLHHDAQAHRWQPSGERNKARGVVAARRYEAQATFNDVPVRACYSPHLAEEAPGQ